MNAIYGEIHKFMVHFTFVYSRCITTLPSQSQLYIFFFALIFLTTPFPLENWSFKRKRYFHQNIRFDRIKSITFWSHSLIYGRTNKIEQTQIKCEMLGVSYRIAIDSQYEWKRKHLEFSRPENVRATHGMKQFERRTYGGQLIICLLCFIIYCLGDAISHLNSYISHRLILSTAHKHSRTRRNMNFPIRISLVTCFKRSRARVHVSRYSLQVANNSRNSPIAHTQYTFRFVASIANADADECKKEQWQFK